MSKWAAQAPLYRYRFGDIELDEARSLLFVAGEPVSVEPRMFALLLELLRHTGEVVTREELIELVWAGRPTVPNVIANTIAKLRKALGPQSAAAIVNLPRVGYRLDAAVERTVVQAGGMQATTLRAGDPVAARPEFRLERVLDRSPGSEVWLARDEAAAQTRVFKFSLDGRRLSALKREAALSRVLREVLGKRPDIVYVADWNFEHAPFHLESEYGGTNLLEWAEQGELATMARPQRLALFLQIADAAAAAHGVGVLHKDIKPANVLIAATPEGGWQARLTDFGSGGLLDPTLLAQLGITRPGLLETAQAGIDGSSGTPLYYAPELIAGQPPSVRSDLYALGMLLYQMLIGDLRCPLVPGWEREVGHDLLAGDIARATDVEPARRFASVEEFARSLRELELRQQAQARQSALESEARRARQIAARVQARRPWVLATIAMLLVGLGAFAWQYGRALRASELAQQEARYANRVNQVLIEDILRPADPARTGKPDPTMRDVLENASARVEQRTNLPPAVATTLHTALAVAHQNRSNYAAAEAEYRKAIARGTPGNRHVVRAELELVRLLAIRSRMDEARQMLDRTLESISPLENHGDSTRRLAWWTQASLLGLEHRLDEAAIAYEKALSVPDSQENGESEADLSAIRANLTIELADVYSRGSRIADAERVLRALLDRDGEALPASIRAKALLLLGRSLTVQKHYPQARDTLEQALETMLEAYGPTNYFVHATQTEISTLYSLVGEHTAALDQAQQGYDGFVALFGTDDHQIVWFAQQERASAHFHAGQSEAALEDWHTAHTGLRGQFGAESPVVMGMAWRMAFALAELDRLDESEALLADVDGDSLNVATGDTLWPARVQAVRGLLHSGRGETTQAVELLDEAIAILEQGDEPRRYLDVLETARTRVQRTQLPAP